MAIPGIFPAVEYDGSMLVDGGVLCNFPLEYAKRLPRTRSDWDIFRTV